MPTASLMYSKEVGLDGDLITVPCSAHWRKLETSLAKPEAVVWQTAQIINTQELQGRDLAL